MLIRGFNLSYSDDIIIQAYKGYKIIMGQEEERTIMEEICVNTNITRYLNHCKFEKGLDNNTIKAYRIDLTQYSVYARQTNNDHPKETIQSYIAYLHTKYKIKTMKRKVASIKAFYNYMGYEGIISENPFSTLQIKLHEPFLLPRIIPFENIQHILQYVYRQKNEITAEKNEYRACLRDIAVLELLFATGMRVSELCSIHLGDIDMEEGIVKIYGKGAKERIVQIGNAEVLLAISSYYDRFGEKIEKSGWFFVNRLGNCLSAQSVRFMINEYCHAAGISQHITPHMFRHSFATYLLEEDVDIRYIQQLLGHSSITTTQIYTHVSTKKQREILATKHPRNKISIS